MARNSVARIAGQIASVLITEENTLHVSNVLANMSEAHLLKEYLACCTFLAGEIVLQINQGVLSPSDSNQS